ncbi:uncharacterized protein SPAPADRAFT_50604 [Spathaspora passalidarum NRRL Y-27907]|uniref:Peptidase A1 domain-containing protein n=1 Tax=Spathaspora passalidarum (strain NRRL Y-27907 / 11-Y1) TaxID=619300 RepID=G3ANR6_SPAPN|nr:uncharacterized protein SPAPADRAFT_50604 [Spathaspora passalidarum NRRL Y-27907]EGW32001.1 hypothetical protein SPAPADRAFT_50604 [Spathaspora passalidarum NRRL Y-27907]
MQLVSLLTSAAILSTVASTPVNVTRTGYISLPISLDGAVSPLGQSKDEVSSTLSLKEQLFLTDLQIGSSGEQVTVVVDTGSEYLWVMDSNVECDDGKNDCQQYGSFSTGNSNSFVKDDSMGEFEVAYSSGQKTTGYWAKDDVSLVGASPVKGFEFGIAEKTSSKFGILGLNFPRDPSKGYSFPQQLHDQGIISRNAYSVFLNSKSAGQGSIMFGAVDHSKYEGDLVSVPVQYNETFPRILVNARIDVNNNGNSVNNGGNEVGYILDTGSTRSRLPSSYLNTLTQLLDGTYDEQWHGVSFDSCSKLDSVVFYVNFYGKTISIPAKSLDYGTQGGRCLLQLNFDDDLLILGMDVLRSIYFLVDLDDREVQLAQAKYGDDNADIEVFQPTGSELLASSKKDAKVLEQTSGGSIMVNPIKAVIVGLLLVWFI